MAVYPGSAQWRDNVYLFETSDIVLGGVDGIVNQPPKELADRTTWLKQGLYTLSGITSVAESKTLTKDECAHKLVLLNANSSSISCVLPTLNSGDANFTVRVKCGVLGRQASLISSAGFMLDGSARTVLYLSTSEEVYIVWSGSEWIVIEFTPAILEVGKVQFDYKQRLNTVVANGQVLNRAEYPRLWEFVSSIPDSIMNELTWITEGRTYRGFFSSGNETSTFRVPDLRGMFIRGLDLGAGISLARNSPNAGGYEADEFKEHDHTLSQRKATNDSGTGSLDEGAGLGPTIGKTDKTGGLETRPKNIGLIPLISI
jgi:hypothetical protein